MTRGRVLLAGGAIGSHGCHDPWDARCPQPSTSEYDESGADRCISSVSSGVPTAVDAGLPGAPTRPVAASSDDRSTEAGGN